MLVFYLPKSIIFSLIIEQIKEKHKWGANEVLSTRLSDFNEFAYVLDVVNEKGVAVAMASQPDVDAASEARCNFFKVTKTYIWMDKKVQ